MRIPHLAVHLLVWLMPSEEREAALGDAMEEYGWWVEEDGRARADRWLRRQVLRSVAPAIRYRLTKGWGGRKRGRGGDGMATMWMKDVGLALRALRRRPLFAATVMVTLALGVGANTALFGVFRAVFLEPLPLPDPGRLVVVMESGGFGCCGPASGPDYLDWSARARAFQGMAALSPTVVNLTGLREPERLYATRVTASAFPLLRVSPLLGRTLLPEDEADPSVVVLSYGLWQRITGGDREVLGSTLNVNGMPYAVVGVMPEGFDVPSPWARTRRHQLYLPFARDDLALNRGNHSYPVIARLSDGVTKEAAQQDMDRVMRELADEYPDTNAARGARVFTIHEYLFGDVGGQLLLVLGAAAVVLLVACGNVAGLQLARAAARETELAVRGALGASRSALVRLLFSESLVLALVGGLAGVAVARGAVDGLRALLPPTIPRAAQVHMDGWALLFALAAAAVTALVFGVFPALLGSRSDLASGVKEGGYATLAPRKERMRDYFIVGQIALGLILANGAALLVQSYAHLRGQEYGFSSEDVLTTALSPSGTRYQDPGARLRYFEEVSARVAALPGVVSVGAVTRLPLNGGSNGNVLVEGSGPRANADEGPLVEVASASGNYFQAMGIPLLSGRTLEPGDTTAAAVRVVINQAMAEEAWPGENPLGKRFSFSDDPPRWLTVVGVVGDVRQWGPAQPPLAQVYFPYPRGWSSSAYLVIRAAGDAGMSAPELRRAILAVDALQPPSSIRSMEAYLDTALAQRRFYTTLIGLFALSAVFLAAAGIYGTVSYFVTRRVRELGIRMALGAGGTGIMRLVLRRGLRVAVWGVGLGLLGTFASTSLVGRFLYGTRPLDPLTLLGGCALLAAVTVAASGLPALRAVRVPPVLALRSE